MATEARSASGLERLIYKHGGYALAWVIAKRLSGSINGAALLDAAKIKASLSAPYDQLRQTLCDATISAMYSKGPLALFRNQTDVVPLLQNVSITYYGLSADPALEHKKNLYKAGQPYPVDLFAYLVSKAPQIGNLV